MQIFELHFNPKPKDDWIFDTFVYEPENFYEKKLGGLCLLGEIKDAVSHPRFIDSLTKIIKEKYYTLSAKSPEKALSESLKKANDFLSQEVKKNNVAWLGKLNFAIASIKDFGLTVAKTGSVKIFLIRGKQIMDVGKNLDQSDLDPYPLKVFVNVVTGKMIENDRIVMVNKKVYDFFTTHNVLEKIAATQSIDAKNIKEIMPPVDFNRPENKDIAGACLIMIIKGKNDSKSRIKEIYEQKIKEWSFHFDFFKKIKKTFSFKLPKVARKEKEKLKKKIKLPKFEIFKNIKAPEFLKKIKKALPSFYSFLKDPARRKNMIVIIILIIILLLGFLIFN
jgi:hypothetical protein